METTRILCFGDSLTWGFDPATRTRLPEDVRWPGVLQSLLGEGYRVIEEAQSGRTIATEDPAEGEKNGLRYVIPCLESQSPLDLMIVMLGGNDLKRKFGYASIDIAGEMQILLEKIQSYNRFRMGDKMKVLLMAPPVIGEEVSDPWLEDCFDFPGPGRSPGSWRAGMSSWRRCTTVSTWTPPRWSGPAPSTGSIWRPRAMPVWPGLFIRS